MRGTGHVKCGERDLGAIPYEVAVDVGGHAAFVKFQKRLKARSGDKLHVTLEDGRMLDCEVLDASPYCAVVGEGPYEERRAVPR